MDFAGRLGPALEGRRIPGLTLLVQVRLPPGLYSVGLQRLAGITRQLLATRLRALQFRKVTFAAALDDEARVLARARAHGYPLTLLTTLSESGGRLHLSGRLWDTKVSLWGRLKGRGGRLLTHLHVSAPLDAELRSYLMRPSSPKAFACLGTWTPLGTEAVWGAALGDVDGDGRTELVLLLRDRLVIQRWSTVYRRFDAVATVKLSGAAAAVRPRHALASLALADLDGDRRLDILVRSWARAEGHVVTYKGGRFTEQRRVDGYPVGALRLAGRVRLVTILPLAGRAEWNGRSLSFQPAFRARFRLPAVVHALGFGQVRRPRTKPIDLVGSVDRKGRLTVQRVGDGRVLQRVARSGVAFALEDLTDDGRPEVITTTARRFGSRDGIVVRKLGGKAAVCRVAGFAGSVTALSAGDVYLDGRARIVAAVWNEEKRRSYLLVVR